TPLSANCTSRPQNNPVKAARGEASSSLPPQTRARPNLPQADSGFERFKINKSARPKTTIAIAHRPGHSNEIGPAMANAPAAAAKPRAIAVNNSNPANPSNRSRGVVARINGSGNRYQRAYSAAFAASPPMAPN